MSLMNVSLRNCITLASEERPWTGLEHSLPTELKRSQWRELYQSLYTSIVVTCSPGKCAGTNLLFIVIINDLPSSAKSSLRLVADDSVVYREIRSEKDCLILKDDLHINKQQRNQTCCIYLTCPTKFRVLLHSLKSISERSIHKLEMVQQRAARYIKNRYHNTSSVTDKLVHLDMEALKSRRTKAQLTMMFRIINNLVGVHGQQYLLPASSRTRAAHSHKYRQISTSTSYYKNSFFHILS